MIDIPEPSTISHEVTTLVRARMADVVNHPVAEVDLTARVTELPGMDSAKLVEVVVWCEARWNIELDEEVLFDARTGEDLCEIIAEAIAAKRAS
ncbi:acyl carrier protein [Amycolatopsis sp. EV170708-02-1]|uniref:acyl carrier protein n=1 Tax=Amycolatopsis sp. EV170708-02-1 TaxID=2919322 RepID=UPI001F0C1716|nr:acyl carrier protein [Amycolatopsis sp. EV170708-02-1]UMP06993.1 acyl carrier protein [Amycolatopsis sp. EV170708-02-1]